jgi:hypothetical protein
VRIADHGIVEPVWAATIWGLWSCWLLVQRTKAAPALARLSAALLVAELVALAVHSYGCGHGRCGPAATAAGSAASIDLPALAALFVAGIVAREWRRARRAEERQASGRKLSRGEAGKE